MAEPTKVRVYYSPCEQCHSVWLKAPATTVPFCGGHDAPATDPAGVRAAEMNNWGALSSLPPPAAAPSDAQGEPSRQAPSPVTGKPERAPAPSAPPAPSDGEVAALVAEARIVWIEALGSSDQELRYWVKRLADALAAQAAECDEARANWERAGSRAEQAEALVDAFKAAAMLDVGGDPDGVTPAHVEREITTLRAENEALREKLEIAEEWATMRGEQP